MLPSRFLAQVALSLVLLSRANAETHVIQFVNQCGFGSPALMYNGNNILTSDTYTSNGAFSGIAYLQTGFCNTNGENCTLLETTLINPACAGCGSSTDISLIPPHAYSVETSFAYYSGCDGQGQTCSGPSCTNAAFFAPNDNFVQVGCEINNVNLLVAFCAEAAQFIPGNGTAPSGSPTTSSLPTPSSTHMSETPVPPLTTASMPSVLPSGPYSVPPVRPVSSGTPSLAPPGTPSTSPPVSPPTPSPTETDDPGCGEPTTSPLPPPPTPTISPSGTGSDPGCDEPTTVPPSQTMSMPTPLPPPTPSTPAGSAPSSPPVPSGSGSGLPPAPPPPASGSPTPSRRCRPRPTGLTSSTPTPTPTSPATSRVTQYMPLTTSGTPDPCDDTTDPTPAAPQRRHHRRMNRVQY